MRENGIDVRQDPSSSRRRKFTPDFDPGLGRIAAGWSPLFAGVTVFRHSRVAASDAR